MFLFFLDGEVTEDQFSAGYPRSRLLAVSRRFYRGRPRLGGCGVRPVSVPKDPQAPFPLWI